jgi:nucleotide-binding universal stress UspA family protein
VTPGIRTILLPVDFPRTSLGVVQEAATWARHFHADLVMLHVLSAESQIAGVPETEVEFSGWDLLAAIERDAGNTRDRPFGKQLDGLMVRRVLRKGDVAQAIIQTAQDMRADLIMMPSHGRTFEQFLQGSITAQADATECPIWTDAHAQGSPARESAIRNVICAVNFAGHSRKTVSWAAHVAAEFGARLWFAHVTAGVESWGPGGSQVDPAWSARLVGDAADRLAELQHDMGIKAEIFIGSGDVPTVLSEGVKQTNADLLVTGSRPYGVHLRTHCYGIISAVPVPVLSI